MLGRRRIQPKIILLWTLLAVLPLLGLLGCGGDVSKEKAEGEMTPVSLRLQWFPLAQFAGFYVAEEKGFYKEEGFDAKINPGGPDFNAVTLVANNSDTFGIWTADQILGAISKDVPIKIIAAIYRKDPNVLMTKKGSAIKSPKDFVGKTVTTVYGRSTETVLRALLKKEGIDEKSVNIEPFPFNVQSFVEGKVDVSAAYVYDHVYQARKMGVEVDLIDPADYGISFYSDCLFARTDLIESNPKLVEAFVHATLKGWEYALDHKDESVEIVLQTTQGLDKESQSYMLEQSEPLIRNENKEKLGLVSAESLDKMKQVLLDQEIIEKDFQVGAAFTNAFVESYYAQ